MVNKITFSKFNMDEKRQWYLRCPEYSELYHYCNHSVMEISQSIRTICSKQKNRSIINNAQRCVDIYSLTRPFAEKNVQKVQ